MKNPPFFIKLKNKYKYRGFGLIFDNFQKLFVNLFLLIFLHINYKNKT